MAKDKTKKGFWTEFKEFISRGSVIDLAVGVIIGSAFTAIVNSFIKDIVSPVIGWIMGGLDLTGYSIALAGENAILYGSFIQNVINFLITALVIFMMVKGINKLHRKKEEAPAPAPAPDPQLVLLEEIRDLLKEQK